MNTTIKCIMISQVSAKELISKAYSAGIDFFISKPINLIEVRSVLKMWNSRSQTNTLWRISAGCS